MSILNTWKGPQWTGCQSITSVLLCLCGSVLNEQPLLNEPGIGINHVDYNKYNEIVRFKNFEVAIADMLERKDIENDFSELRLVMKNNFLEKYKDIIERLDDVQTENKSITTSIYKMRTNVNYTEIKRRLENIHHSFTKLN